MSLWRIASSVVLLASLGCSSSPSYDTAGSGPGRGGAPGSSSDDAGSASSAEGGGSQGGGGPEPDAATTTGPGDDAGAGAGDAGDPYGTPTVCSSGKTWLLGTVGSDQMQPGVACDTCHKLLGTATRFPFDVAGTVYSTAHEPDECNGASGATVVVTDANGTDHTLTVDAVGNFFNLDYAGVGAIATPYKARVVANGKTRAMISAQSSGDCNSCHTVQGTQGAQGRIMMP